jgi:hypothetical protein
MVFRRHLKDDDTSYIRTWNDSHARDTFKCPKRIDAGTLERFAQLDPAERERIGWLLR